MKVISVNVSLPCTITWSGREIETGIFKEPIDGPCEVKTLNLAGDQQADLTVHGGPHKAVYGYPVEHYDFWREFLGLPELPFGAMGENLTTEGLTEDNLNIGDVVKIGTTELVVAQPRNPCYKMQAKFNREDIVRRFIESGFSGFYFFVRKEGMLQRGDHIEILSRDDQRIRVSDINRIQRGEPVDPALLRRALTIDALPDQWKNKIRRAMGE